MILIFKYEEQKFWCNTLFILGFPCAAHYYLPTAAFCSGAAIRSIFNKWCPYVFSLHFRQKHLSWPFAASTSKLKKHNLALLRFCKDHFVFCTNHLSLCDHISSLSPFSEWSHILDIYIMHLHLWWSQFFLGYEF